MINVVVEGESDKEAAAAVVVAAGRTVARTHVARGKGKLDQNLRKYNAAARHQSWVVFRDSDSCCPVELRERLLRLTPEPNPRLSLRIAHTMTEAWLLADRRAFCEFFSVNAAKIPRSPEELNHAKRSLLDLCAKSTSRTARQDMVTTEGETGPLYVLRINEFARDHWDVHAAAQASPSLRRAVAAIRNLPSSS